MIIEAVVLVFACAVSYVAGKGTKLGTIEAELKNYETSAVAEVKTLVAAIKAKL